MAETSSLKAFRVLVKGTVQGVGFRPFVYRLATRLGLTGYVRNVGQGVEIFLEGSRENFEKFLHGLREELPPLARLESLEWLEARPENHQKFSIDRSRQEEAFVFISPDIATCSECLKEIETPGERRYGYPFTNCTNCGPRYTIVKALPYDRASTTMADFPMCPDCQREYEDPSDRRYHAQPIACPVCGPAIVILEARTRKPVSRELSTAAELIKKGKILAVKGLGGFHLMGDALNLEVVQRIRKIKNRQVKPLALMADSLQTIKKYAYLSPEEENWLTSPRRPIVLLRKKKDLPGIAPGIETIGFMLPYTPLHHLLLKSIPLVVATSSNLKDAPIIKDDRLIDANLCDYILTHNREIAMRADDSVMKLANGRPLFLRRARGFVPFPQRVPEGLKVPARVLAVGGELKNTISIYKAGYVVTSQFLGDLDDYQNFSYFQETLNHLSRLFNFKPEYVVSDLHPDFQSTRFARSLGLPHFQVQHHHAHLLAALVEHNIPPGEKVLGVSFDGFGYGQDGQAWGGEFLLADYDDYLRLAHLEYVPLPGGDLAAREPWRMAVSYLRQAGGKDFPLPGRLKEIPEEKIQTVNQMIEKGINCPLTSSVGRLFDAVSFLCGLAPWRIEYEAQAPALLEAAALTGSRTSDKSYKFSIKGSEPPFKLSFSETIQELVNDLKHKNFSAGQVARKFHLTLVEAIWQVAELARKNYGINTVVLVGGVFLNRFLTEHAENRLQEKKFRVLRPLFYSPNDESLSLGQIAFALNKIKKKEIGGV